MLSLNAISPIDGRYHRVSKFLAPYFSEKALIKYRVLVEVEYFIALTEIPLKGLTNFPKNYSADLQNLYQNFSDADAQAIKDIEAATNHDVKAVEYWLRQQFENLDLAHYAEFIHFGLTSQDINNTAVPLSLKTGFSDVLYPEFIAVISTLKKMAEDWKNISMLARTHGQPASPTRLGKELCVFVERLETQFKQLEQISYNGKFGGATGNFNAHHVAYPDIDWVAFADKLLEEKLGLQRLSITTQIEHYDNLAAFCDNLKRINTIMVDLCRDIWTYIMLEYFRQRSLKNEVGSSAMPHKVNPIDFENAEGNLGLANAIFTHLSAKLPISRLQRDLTDSTVIRNLGVPLAHTLIALKSLQKGLGKLLVNEEKIAADLNANWAVTAEAIQTVLRREGVPNPYEQLKELTRGKNGITRESIAAFIESLDVAENIKAELRLISPQNYTGIDLF